MIIQRKITQPYNHSIEISKTGLAAVFISARCRSRKQLNGKRDEDLRVEIDNFQFREIPPRKRAQLFNIPASWNGSKLKGLEKTIVFLIVLQRGKHTLRLIPRDSAFVEEIEIEELNQRRDIEFDIEEQAEDGDRRPWYTFVLVNLPLRELVTRTTIQYRWWDSDDVKVIVDNKIQRQPKVKLHRFWFFAGILIKKLFKKLLKRRITLKHSFAVDLPQSNHYIEFWADKTPILHEVELSLGEIEFKAPSKRIPTVDNPKWTGNFQDDPEEILLARLIFGEARNQPREAKIWVAGAVINRVEATAWFDTIKKVILQPKQYDPFKPSDENYSQIIDPLQDADSLTIRAWQDCYKIAKDIISGKIENPTKATHFHGIGISKDWFLKNVVPEGKFLRKIGDTYFYWSPN